MSTVTEAPSVGGLIITHLSASEMAALTDGWPVLERARERMAAGDLTAEQATAVARELASALEAVLSVVG